MFLEYTNSHFILPVLVRSLEWSDLLLNPCLSSSRNSSAFRQRVQPGRIHRTGLWHLRNALRGIDNLSDTKSEYLRAYSHIISFKVSKIMTFRKIFSLVATHTHTHTHTHEMCLPVTHAMAVHRPKPNDKRGVFYTWSESETTWEPKTSSVTRMTAKRTVSTPRLIKKSADLLHLTASKNSPRKRNDFRRHSHNLSKRTHRVVTQTGWIPWDFFYTLSRLQIRFYPSK